MSNLINNYFLNAQLSNAAYALDLNPSMSPTEFREALTGEPANFSDSQADTFIERYTIVDSQQNTEEGFSGTVFLDNQTGKFVVSLRGTEAPGDIIDDVLNADFGDIGGNGIAVSQAIDMFNYLQRLTAKAGEPIVQYSYSDEFPLVAGLGEITSTTLPPALSDGPLAGKEFSVNGHSLGGHLALILSRLAPNQVTETFTYNAPGFDTTAVPFNDDTEEFFETLRNLEIARTGESEIGFAFDVGSITNLVVPNDIVSDIGFVPGTRIEQFTETIPLDPITSHSIQKVTDVLTVSSLLATLDPAIPQIKILNILKAGSSIADNSLEEIVSQLRAVLFSEPIQPIINREQLYTDINAINNLILTSDGELTAEFLGLSVTSISGFSSSGLFSLSQDPQRGLAFRYALTELSPFVIEGSDSIYDSNELSLENFSESYLTDRAEFLAAKIRTAINDVSVENFSPAGSKEFIDINSGFELITRKDVTSLPEQRLIFGSDQSEGRQVFGTSNIEDHVYGGGGIDTIFGGGGDDYIEGNADDDNLHGEDGEDILVGGDGADMLDGGDDNDTLYGDSNDPNNTTATGADTLIGGKGSDILKGGKGNDILYGGEKSGTTHIEDNAIDTLEGGDGNDNYFVGQGDIINDSDRTGTIDFNGVDVSGEFIQQAGDVYKNETSGLILTIGGNDATIRQFNGSENTFFTIQNFKEGENFSNGDFGITLTLADDPDPIPDPEATTRDILGDRQIIDQDPGTPGDQVAFDDLGNIITDPNIVEAREDDLNGSTGNDNIVAGDMDDTVNANAGDDTIDGGAGDDVLEGDDGDDQLFGGAGNDELEGNDGDDYLDGGSGNDELEGDKGNDQLFGGAGNDELEGDEGDDYLDGGSGNDELEGDKGNDQLFGGAGNDELEGDEGDDYLDGGSGNDELEGGKGNDTYQFNRGYDSDWIDGEKKGDDTVMFADVNHDELWFWRNNDDLHIGILDTLDRLTIEDWYDNDNRIETFNTTDDGFILTESNVQQLVDAMATFSAPSSGSLDVPQNIQDDVQSVITTAWQTA